MLLRMSKDSWTVIGTGIALAALLLQQAGSLRADIRDVRQEVRDVRQDVRGIRSDLADVRERLSTVETQLQYALPAPTENSTETVP